MILDQDLFDFYAEHDPTKTTEDIATLLDKYEPRLGHYKLAKKLEKKYGTAPKTVPYKKSKQRRSAHDAPAPSTKTPSSKSSSPKKQAKPVPNLHLATVEELQAELDKRQAEDDDDEDGNGDDDDDDDELDLTLCVRACVRACARVRLPASFA